MENSEQTFTVFTDEAAIAMIKRASYRLVVIAPALTEGVADALSARLGEQSYLDIRVILDADAEVYRLGFGEREALNVIRDSASRNHLDLREQPGIRIGVIISDEDTMVFAPVSQNIEAGSNTPEKPNAILLRGSSSESLARAAGVVRTDDGPDGEIGKAALEPEKVEAMTSDLERNPPTKFDITRRMQVFASRVVYVELELKNFKIGRKSVPLDGELKTTMTKDMQAQISVRLHAPTADIGKMEVEVGEGRSEKIDDAWLQRARKEIEDLYTYRIENYGLVILREDYQKFEQAVETLRSTVERYREKVHNALEGHREAFCEYFVAEFLPRWKESPPDRMTRWVIPDENMLRQELEKKADKVFNKMLDFKPPSVRLVEKNVSPKNVDDPMFTEGLKNLMVQRCVPDEIIASLFSTGGAAPEQPNRLNE